MEKSKIESYSNNNYQKEQAYLRAKKRVKELKGFYWHAFWYTVVNIFIIFMIVSNGGDLWHFGTFSTAIFWGLGLGFHALAIFGKNFIFSKKWEERKIKEYMDNDKKKWK
ncbi:MAG: 2TM domain-containing protein [Flaviramulus sp.]|nr:2TM domain-containing protein [Flaviramulus sp.]NNC50624.1 2TM domain-containing protein [Flaviramulus sp.]